jgi:hypothetical protein
MSILQNGATVAEFVRTTRVDVVRDNLERSVTEFGGHRPPLQDSNETEPIGVCF